MKTTNRIGLFMGIGMILVIGVCLTYVFWRTNELIVAQVQDKALFLIKTFEAQMDLGYGKEVDGANAVYQNDLKEIQAGIPMVLEINVYRVSDSPSVVASTEDSQVGKAADPEDVKAARTDAAVVLFGDEGGQGFIDITAPLHFQNKIGYVMGIKLSVQNDWDALRWLLFQTVAIGVAAVVVALLVILFILGRMRRTLGAEPEDLAVLVDRVAEGRFDSIAAQDGRPPMGVRSNLELLAASLGETSRQIGELAAGDFRVEVSVRSNQDTLALSLRKLTGELSRTLTQVRLAMGQVLAGAEQVGVASQSLSQATTLQASSLEEVSASVTELGRQTRTNADQALRSKALADQASAGVLAGNRKMAELVEAIRAMEAASMRIQGVVKTIDDIAFQTNLLALNANVEAGRAGKIGAGFGVVAGEVRNLSLRSSQAVKETSALVKECLATIQKGVVLVGEVEGQLTSIGRQAAEVAAVVGTISEASGSQASGLRMIEEALESIDRSTQANAATSEQTASSAQVLNDQARGVQRLLDQFHLRDED